LVRQVIKYNAAFSSATRVSVPMTAFPSRATNLGVACAKVEPFIDRDIRTF